jgi:hypothetical protein
MVRVLSLVRVDREAGLAEHLPDLVRLDQLVHATLAPARLSLPQYGVEGTQEGPDVPLFPFRPVPYPGSVGVNGTFNVAPFPHVFESPGSQGWLTESLGTQEVTEIILLEGLTHTFGSERIQTIRVFIKRVFRYSCKCKREAKFSVSLYLLSLF